MRRVCESKVCDVDAMVQQRVRFFRMSRKKLCDAMSKILVKGYSEEGRQGNNKLIRKGIRDSLEKE